MSANPSVPIRTPYFATVRRTFVQHGPWVGLSAMALAGVLGLELYLSRNAGQSIASGGFVATAAVLFGILGVAIGLAVLLPDMRPGHWGFLAHRPVGRRRQFFAISIAAALLYGAGTTFAVGVAVALAHDTHFSRVPFTWPSLAYTLAAQLNGLAWLAAAMLIAARRARWTGSGLMPLLSVGLATMYAWGAGINGPILQLLVAALAVCGASFFAANGEYEPQPRWARPLAFFTLFPTLAAAVALFVTLCFGFAHDLVGRDDSVRLNETYYMLDDLGHPYRVSFYNNGITQTTEVDGRPSWTNRDIQNSYFYRAPTLTPNNPFDPDRTRSVYARQGFDPSGEVGVLRTTDERRGAYWVFIGSRRTLEAYSFEGVYLGGIGPDGFYDAKAKPQPFPPTSRAMPESYSGDSLVLSNDTIWAIDILNRKVKVIFQTPADQPILDAIQSRIGYRADLFVSVLTPNHVHALPAPFSYFYNATTLPAPATTAPATEAARTVEIPSVTASSRLVAAAFGVDGLAVIVDPVPGPDRHPVLIKTLYGQTTTTPLPALPIPTESTVDRAPLAMTLPPLLAGYASIRPNERLAGWSSGDVGWTVRQLGGWMAVVPVLSAGWTLWLLRRRRLSGVEAGVWIAAALLLGPGVPLTMIFLCRRLVRTRCPACGRPRPVDSDRCPRCQANWPVPGDPATDVFEDDLRPAA